MSTHPPTLSKPSVPASGTDHDALPPGTRFGEFEILRVLGVGGFGIVYLAQDHSLEREVALKEYMPASLAARGAGPQITVRSSSFAETYAIGLRSFINEARLLARFDHPSLVKVYRFWEDNATAYMVMPFLQGVTLRDARRGMAHAPDEAWIRSVLTPILSALELLHREGVYHRDIAPDNILLPRDGPPVLLDFGAARRVISDRTQSLTAILKPSYAPIEQYAEMTQLRQGPWTDIYALGAVVHYLCFGVPPAPATARAVQDDGDAIESRIVPGVSPRFLEAMSWMLAIRPNQRPQSGEQLRAVLDGRAEIPPRGRPGITMPGALAPVEPGRRSSRSPTRPASTPPTCRRTCRPRASRRRRTSAARPPSARRRRCRRRGRRRSRRPTQRAAPQAPRGQPTAQRAAAKRDRPRRPRSRRVAMQPRRSRRARSGAAVAARRRSRSLGRAAAQRREGPPSAARAVAGPHRRARATRRRGAVAAEQPRSRRCIALPPLGVAVSPLAAAPFAPGKPAASARGASKPWLVLAGGGLFVAVAALAAWQFSGRRDGAAGRAGRRRASARGDRRRRHAGAARRRAAGHADHHRDGRSVATRRPRPRTRKSAPPTPAVAATADDRSRARRRSRAARSTPARRARPRVRPPGKPVPRVGEDPAVAANNGPRGRRGRPSPSTRRCRPNRERNAARAGTRDAAARLRQARSGRPRRPSRTANRSRCLQGLVLRAGRLHGRALRGAALPLDAGVRRRPRSKAQAREQ